MPESTTGASSAPLADEPTEVEVRSSELVFDGMVWGIRRDVFDYHGEDITREYMDHTGAVAVFAMDENDQVLLIQQYRHPVGMREWEIPAGLLDVEGEDPLVAAQRELAEEVDLEARDWKVLAEFATSPGGSDEVIRIYLARGLSSTGEAFERTAEEADIVVRWAPLDELVTAVLERRIQNPSLCIAVLAASAAERRNWDTLGDANAPWTRHPKFGSSSAS
ncbi:ADP-ribose pyrophosphatase [Okibacterium sp. HSC-33S16]|uniref:NUDIX domain-containing protein n=1 Tax=Okibacterium sp. HSC-33S16 TaxID=2910965 RepID=UPI0020A1EEE3|nr:NUDIX hydrolase [Okibacterium sp. HSC-33S16]MCP2032562.1 ADP-ribose pyrophosphatase [Okibacterium sp. HSC-33S16]